jgi:hypothetical protein
MPSLFTLEELVLDYPIIYGVASPKRPLKLAFELSIHPDIEVDLYKETTTYSKESLHETYLISHLDDEAKCFLVKNKGTNELFYPKYKQVDYLVCSIDEDEIKSEIIQIISKLRGISICFALEEPNQKQILNFTSLQ